MKQLAIIVALSASLLLAAESIAQDAHEILTPSFKPKPADSANKGDNDVFAIPSEELAVLKAKALGGDGESARKIAIYFNFYKYDALSGKYWLQISAEDGYELGQLNLAEELDDAENVYRSEPPDEIQRDKERACFWFKKAAENGAKADEIDADARKHCKL
jgi:TPR repeat protein